LNKYYINISSLFTVGPNVDEWSNWLLHTRHAGDPNLESVLRIELERIADRILDAADIRPG
jgi:arsenite methyltransferase